jgi:hypothetical protein
MGDSDAGRDPQKWNGKNALSSDPESGHTLGRHRGMNEKMLKLSKICILNQRLERRPGLILPGFPGLNF